MIRICGILFLFCMLPAPLDAEFLFVTNNGAITITGYQGPGGDVVIPSTINGLPVTMIGDRGFYQQYSLRNISILASITAVGESAFAGCTGLTNLILPDSVGIIGSAAFQACTNLATFTMSKSLTNLGAQALAQCPRLTSAAIPDGVSVIREGTFGYCAGLASVTIPNSVTNIEQEAFLGCQGLPNVRISRHVTFIGEFAFSSCVSLAGAYFEGAAPAHAPEVFPFCPNVTAYYLPGTVGWGASFGDAPTAPWFIPNPQILVAGAPFGVATNGFSFIVSWATNASLVVEAATSLASPAWTPVGTNTLMDGWTWFSDVQWTNSSTRFYRVRSP